MSYKIIVDSCADLSSALLRGGDFIPVPLSIRVGGQVLADDRGLDRAALLRAMADSPQAARTACPSPAQFLDAFDCGADELYVVTLSALLSGTHNSAAQAVILWKEAHPGARIHLFNSRSASAGEALTALRIQELAWSGLPFEQVVERTDQFIRGLNTLFVLEDLDNLRKSGRLSRLQSAVTGALSLKLILGGTPEGEIARRGQAFSVKQALGRLCALMATDPGHVGKTLYLTHCACLERAMAFKELVRRQCRFSDIFLSETGGVSTVYANRGGLVAAY